MQRCQPFVAALVLCCLVAATLADNAGAACTNAQLNLVGQQDAMCDLDSPFCVYVTPTLKQCEYCTVLDGKVSSYGGVAACNCDPTQYYCGQSNLDQNAGACLPYTILNNPCTQDSQCQTTTTTRLASTGNTVTVTQERLFCVNNLCKPCDPVAWAADVGPLGVATVTCAGFDPTVSANLGRYATSTRLAGSSFTCTAAGDFQWVDSAVDYDYQYPCGDRTLWPDGCDNDPSPTPSPAPGSSTTPSADSNSGAGALMPVLALTTLLLLAALATTVKY